MSRSVTLQDLATELGVSKATVSRALNNNPRIAEATRKKISDAARKAGYVPDAIQSRLARRRWRRPSHDHVGTVLIYAVQTSTPLTRSSQQQYDAARLQARKLGYHLQLAYIPDLAEHEQLSRKWYHRGVPAILIGACAQVTHHWKLWMDKFVVVNCSECQSPDLPADWVRPDIFGGTELAIQRCFATGRKRIGLLIPPELNTPYERRRIGALAAAEFFEGGGVSQPVMRNTYKDPALIKEWVQRERLDVVMGLDGGVYDWLVSAGVRVPEEVACISLGADSKAGKCAGATYDQSRVGELAVEHAVSQINLGAHGPRTEPHTIIVPPKWVAAESFPE